MPSTELTRPEWIAALADAAQAAGRVAELGWAPETAGNLSLRLPPPPSGVLPDVPLRVSPLPLAYPRLAGQWFLLSLAGSTMAQVSHEPAMHTLVCNVREDGLALLAWRTAAASADWQPTSELTAHLAVQQFLLENWIGEVAVLHAHLPCLARISQPYAEVEPAELNATLCHALAQFAQTLPQGVSVASGAPGSVELGRQTVAALARSRVVAWPGHGALACAPTLYQAAGLLELAELAAGAVLHRLGLDAPPLPPLDCA